MENCPQNLLADSKLRQGFVRGLRETMCRVAPSGGLRPFVCDGCPLDCGVFVVGYNPATGDLPDFWRFFDSQTCEFDKERWDQARREVRRGTPGTPEDSPTRQRINALVGAIRSAKCLETNLYSKPSRNEGALQKEDKNPEILRFLLEQIRPRVVMTHHLMAEHFVCKEFLNAGNFRPSEMGRVRIADGENGEAIVLVQGPLRIGWAFKDSALGSGKPHVFDLAKLAEHLAENAA